MRSKLSCRRAVAALGNWRHLEAKSVVGGGARHRAVAGSLRISLLKTKMKWMDYWIEGPAAGLYRRSYRLLIQGALVIGLLCGAAPAADQSFYDQPAL